MARLTRKRQASVTAYVTDLQHQLGLCNWRVTVDRTLGDGDDYLARIDIAEEGPVAFLIVTKAMFDLPPTEQRQTLVHELCHLVMDRVDHVVVDQLGPIEGAAKRSYSRAIEHAVDQFAFMIHGQCPLPPWCD